jgi:hypothetical protein
LRSESRLSASSKRLCLKEELKVTYYDDGGAELAFSNLTATSPADSRFDDAKICVNNKPGDYAVNDRTGWIDNDDNKDGNKLSLRYS